ncbi:MAG: DUF2851 family protein, partial [Kiritimatiellia bacterium]
YQVTASFPEAVSYRQFCTGHAGQVAEAGPGLDPFTERHLHCIWFDPRLRPDSLQTERGEEIRILHPGKWNQEKGPDFLDAEWSIGGRRMRGDVEIHLRPMDWKHHGHHQDPHYQRVGLHVTYEHGELPEGLLPGGCEEVGLRTALDRRSHFFFDGIDVHAYPWQKEGGRSGLRAHFEGKTEAECGRMLEAAGQERIRRKSLRMAAAVQSVGEEQALYISLLRGLGYKNNAEISERLARVLPVSRLRNLCGGEVERAYAFLLGAAGLLPPDAEEPGLPPWMQVRRLWDLWWPYRHEFSDRMLTLDLWRLDHCRPGNHPCRRLRAAAEWVSAPDALSAIFLPRKLEPEKDWVKRCLQRLEVHSPAPRLEAEHLVGKVRAGTLFLNAVLPWRICVSPEIAGPELWTRLPDEAFNSKIRHTAARLFGPDQHPRLYRGGLRKQGLLQFHEDFQL